MRMRVRMRVRIEDAEEGEVQDGRCGGGGVDEE